MASNPAAIARVRCAAAPLRQLADWVIRPAARLCYSLTTLYLFIASDIITIIVPVTTAALALSSRAHSLRSVAWTALHVLHASTANQLVSPAAEDLTNKPWRPIPSRRISIQHTRILRWILLPICLLVSAAAGPEALGASVGAGATVFGYNELLGSKHWISRHLLVASGYATLILGATAVAHGSEPLPALMHYATAITVLVVSSTMHAQDFYDEAGDRRSGRKTLTSLQARRLLGAVTLLWGLALPNIWKAPLRIAIVFNGLSWMVAGMFWSNLGQKMDKQAMIAYCGWMTMTFVLPGCGVGGIDI